VIGGEDDDGIRCQTAVSEVFEEFADAVVESRAVGIVAGEILASLCLCFFGNVGTENEFGRIIFRTVLRWCEFIRVVRWPPGEDEKKGTIGFGMGAKVLLGVASLGESVVALPL